MATPIGICFTFFQHLHSPFIPPSASILLGGCTYFTATASTLVQTRLTASEVHLSRIHLVNCNHSTAHTAQILSLKPPSTLPWFLLRMIPTPNSRSWPNFPRWPNSHSPRDRLLFLSCVSCLPRLCTSSASSS